MKTPRIPHLILAAFCWLLTISGAFAQGTLSIFSWSEYIPQTVIDKFQESTGIKVSLENYASNEEMLAKLVSGGSYDLIQPSEYTIEALIKENLLQPLDLSAIPNLKNIAPEYLNLSFDPANKYSVPWMVGSVGIVVNTAKIKEPITGYADLFQEKYKRRIVVLDDARELVSAALGSLGIPFNDITTENLGKARGVLAKWLPLVKVYDSDSPKTSLLNGDTDLGLVWSGEGALLLREDKKFKWVVPKESSHQFIDSLAVPKKSKNKVNAEKFINFILQPEISALISADFPYTNPNLEARKLLSPEDLANPASFPPAEDAAKLKLFKDIGKLASDVDALVTDLRAD